MKPETNNLDSFADFLHARGIKPASREEREALYREYRREYMRLYRHARKSQVQDIVISIPKHELKELALKAEEHDLSLPQFVLQACLAYCRQEFLVPDPESIGSIERSLIGLHCLVRDLAEESQDKPSRRIAYMDLLHQTNELESMIEKGFREPELLKSALKRLRDQNPSLHQAISIILNAL